MPKGSSFDIKIKNSDVLKDTIVLELLNDDNKTEKAEYTLNSSSKPYILPKDGETITVTADYDCVPFVKTKKNVGVEPIIEISNKKDTKDLVYYYYGGNQDKFFKDWNSSQDSFAVIEGKSVTMLVPLKDKDHIIVKAEDKNNENFTSIDSLLEFYDDLTNYYDEFVGLDYNAEEPDKNFKTKYFVKADKSGMGAAYYYSPCYTAFTGDSIQAYFTRGWLPLHEFGHGYQGWKSENMGTKEVSNNILAYYYQKEKILEPNENGWLGSWNDVSNTAKQKREDQTVTKYEDFGNKQMLYMFLNLLNKIGPKQAMAYMDSQYRKNTNISNQDLYARTFSDYSHYNVIPYLESFKVVPSDDVKNEIYSKKYKMIYYLNEIAGDESDKIKNDLNLQDVNDLVSDDDISKYNLKGSVKFKINIDDINQIAGKKIKFMNGTDQVFETEIPNQAEFSISNIPAGIYSLELPTDGKTEVYSQGIENIVVTNNKENSKEVTLTKVQDKPISKDSTKKDDTSNETSNTNTSKNTETNKAESSDKTEKTNEELNNNVSENTETNKAENSEGTEKTNKESNNNIKENTEVKPTENNNNLETNKIENIKNNSDGSAKFTNKINETNKSKNQITDNNILINNISKDNKNQSQLTNNVNNSLLNSKLPKTGDNLYIIKYALLAIVPIILITLLMLKKRS